MLVLFGANSKDLTQPLAKRFGHAEQFVVFNTDDRSHKFFENIDEGHTHSNLLDFIDIGVRAFVVGNIGPHAFSVLKEHRDVKIYLARRMSIQEAFEKVISGELQELTNPTMANSVEDGHNHNHNHDHHHHDHDHNDHHDHHHTGNGGGRHNHDCEGEDCGHRHEGRGLGLGRRHQQ
jgi:predicted Fe-Mo cluster-binding NifX family protein